jgi:hypothetical protein
VGSVQPYEQDIKDHAADTPVHLDMKHVSYVSVGNTTDHTRCTGSDD